MRLAEKKDKKRIVDIICESYDSNPSVNWVIKNDKHRARRIRVLAEYAFDMAYRRKGVYISSNNEGITICYKYNVRKESLGDYIGQAKLALFSIGVSRALKILKREGYTKKTRPANGEFLYFWFWGVSDKARGSSAAKESKDYIFELSKNLQLPIYLETSVPQNKRVYERYGFETYDTWTDNDHLIWLMRRGID